MSVGPIPFQSESRTMKLSRFFTGLAPALAIAAMIGFAAPAPSRADDAPAAAPAAAAATPAAPAPAPAAKPAPPADAGLRRRRRGDRRHRQIRGGPRRPRRHDELHALRRRHRVDADLRRSRADDDDPGPRPVLRRHGAQEERRRHRHDELRDHGAGHGPLRGGHLQPVVHRRADRSSAGSAGRSCRAS